MYRRGPRTGEWFERLAGALPAAGPEAVVSHRAAFALWDLDGLAAKLVEITVPYGSRPVPRGVIRHRTRRIIPGVTVQGLRTTCVERTLLDVAPLVPYSLLAKGVDSAVRFGLTDPCALADVINTQGGRGVRGAKRLAAVTGDLMVAGPTGSPAELDLLDAIRDSGLPMPVPQHEVVTLSGRRYRLDFAWPDLAKAIEVDGLDAHASADSLDRDLIRQNDLLEAGFQLRRFSPRTVRRDLDGVIAAISGFIAS